MFRAHAPPQGAREDLCALKLVANQQTEGGSRVQVLVEGLQEHIAMDEFGRSIKVDNHEAVEIGDVEKYSVALHVVGPSFQQQKTFHWQPSAKERKN